MSPTAEMEVLPPSMLPEARPDEVEQSEVEQASRLVQNARALEIKDQDSYDQAVKFLRAQDVNRGILFDKFNGPKDAAHKAWRKMCDLYNAVLNPYDEALQIVRSKIAAWDRQQQLIALQLQREAEAAERRRQEEEQILAATAVEDMGASPEEVDAVLSQPLAPVCVAAKPVTYQKAAGISTSVRYSGQLDNMMDLCTAIVLGKRTDLLGLLAINQPALNSLAVAQRDHFRVPGCKLVKTAGTTVRKQGVR